MTPERSGVKKVWKRRGIIGDDRGGVWRRKDNEATYGGEGRRFTGVSAECVWSGARLRVTLVCGEIFF